MTVRTNDIALAHLGEQLFRVDAAEHSRHLKRFVKWISVIEVHREEGEALQTIGARHIAQLAHQLGLGAAQSALDNRHMPRRNSYSSTFEGTRVRTRAVTIRADDVAFLKSRD